MHRYLLAWLASVAALLSAAAAPLAVDPASLRLEIAARATMHGFTGRVGSPAISLTADAAGVIDSAVVRFDWADLKTGDAKRDKEMLEWAHADRNPGGTFTLAKLAVAADGSATAAGRLELNGQSRDITFPVTLARDGAGWSVSGETQIDHRNWGLPKIRKFGLLTVDPVVTIRFAFTARPGA